MRLTCGAYLLMLLFAESCVGPGLLTNGSSVSVGSHSQGSLRNGVALPFRGEGYLVPPRWQERRRNYATEELVELLVRTARRVQSDRSGAVLGIADLSPRGGGATPQHRSHYSGRDVDLLFYTADLKGKLVAPTEMYFFDKRGMLVPPTGTALSLLPENEPPPTPPPSGTLDIAANWLLIKALVTDPKVPVQWIFIGRPIADMLLRHARQQSEPSPIIARAAAMLHQPSDAQSHMDHMHVRIFCPWDDRSQGCQDRGPGRWLEKQVKYIDLPAPRTRWPAGFNPAHLPLHNLPLIGL